jgi:imidazolonepropionase-like amidohydrolase
MDVYNDDYIQAEGRRTECSRNRWTRRNDRPQAAPDLPGRGQSRGKDGFGTDAGVYPNGFNARQFATMVQWGMTPMQSIQAATANAAEALGRSSDVGAIAAGRYGDVIAVEGDPLADVSRLQSVAFVMKGGEVVKSPAH